MQPGMDDNLGIHFTAKCIALKHILYSIDLGVHTLVMYNSRAPATQH